MGVKKKVTVKKALVTEHHSTGCVGLPLSEAGSGALRPLDTAAHHCFQSVAAVDWLDRQGKWTYFGRC